jgi:MarR family transcriptional regulator for hemolysin
MQPPATPIGLRLTQVSRAVSRAFDDALATAGGSLPVWLVVLNLKTRSLANQRELAEAMGIKEATLTHHLNAMEASGLVTRHRDPANRRVHVVALTAAGEEAFARLRDAAVAFDRQLRRGITDADAVSLSELLGRLAANAGVDDGGVPWAGFAERTS